MAETRSPTSPVPVHHAPADRLLATVGALVIGPSGRGLFVKTRKWRGLWGVPGGKIDRGETMREALVREFAEETGLGLRDLAWGPVQEAVFSPEFHMSAHFILLNFIAYAEHEEVTLNDEAEAYAWLEPARALDFELNAPTRTLVRFFLERRGRLEAL